MAADAATRRESQCLIEIRANATIKIRATPGNRGSSLDRAGRRDRRTLLGRSNLVAARTAIPAKATAATISSSIVTADNERDGPSGPSRSFS